MNAVIYFSCSGQSKAVAERLSAQLEFPLLDMQTLNAAVYENAVVVFPVHCQGLPVPVKKFLKTLNSRYITLIATYGRESAGNAIYEAYKICKNVIAAAYLPANHTYLNTDFEIPSAPKEVIEKIHTPSYVKIPRRHKTLFAGIAPAFRSRKILKIKKTDACVLCNACADVCPMGAVSFGKINNKCIRCLKCVRSCPHNALKIRQSRILKKYLSKPRFDKVIFYV